MKNSLLIYVCDTRGQALEWVKILPLGKVELRDDRAPFEVTPADLQAITAKFKADNVDLVVDYEHQSLGAEKAPAAGWIKELQARTDGLYARIQWTPTGLKHIQEGEYRYYSPVIQVKRPMRLMHAALTNTPALKGTALTPLLAAKLAGAEEEPEIIVLKDFNTAERKKAAAEGWAMPDGSFPIKTREDLQNAIHDYGRAADKEAAQKHIMARAKDMGMMDELPADWPGSTKKMDGGKPMKKQMMKLLGLPATEDKPDQEILALVDARFKQADSLPEIAQLLALKADAGVPEILGAIKGMQAGQTTLEKLSTEVVALRTKIASQEAEALVAAGLEAGKITPDQKIWALKYAGEQPEEFQAYLKTAPVIVPLKQRLQVAKDTADPDASLEAADLAVCKAVGVTAEAFKVQKAADQKARQDRQ